ncbi:MAG: CHAD domain-containing protein [Verrucomicrobiales bacterium]
MPKLSKFCIELIQERLVDLDDPQALQNEVVVHQLRVLTKRLRAAWHLAQPACGKKFARKRRGAMRDLSALLAESRDRSVQLALVERLYSDHPDLSKRSLQALCDTGEGLSPLADQAHRTQIKRSLNKEISAWKKVILKSDQQMILRRRWRKSMGQARELAHQTARSDDPELWHSWRKAVKRLRYQREFLGMINPQILGKKDVRIFKLGLRLGEHNDLANFARHVASSKNNTAKVKAINRVVTREHAKIKRKCRHLSRKLFGH